MENENGNGNGNARGGPAERRKERAKARMCHGFHCSLNTHSFPQRKKEKGAQDLPAIQAAASIESLSLRT